MTDRRKFVSKSTKPRLKPTITLRKMNVLFGKQSNIFFGLIFLANRLQEKQYHAYLQVIDNETISF